MDKRNLPHTEKAKARIKAGEILYRLQRHIMGKIELSATQISAAKILLGKVLPDLKQTEYSGRIDLGKPEELTEPNLDREIERLLARAAIGEKAPVKSKKQRG